MYIFIFKDFISGPTAKILSHELLMQSVFSYCMENELRISDYDFTVIQDRGKKPYFKDSDIKFNISHSENFWVCVIGKEEAGIDVQAIKDSDYEKLSERYFTDNEKKFVKENKREGFFSIWTRKEAYCKFYGKSIFNSIKTTDTVSEGELVEEIDNISFTDIDIADSVKCTVALSGKGVNLCLRGIG